MSEGRTDIEEQARVLAHLSLRVTWTSGRQLARELADSDLTVPQFITLVAARHLANGCTMSQLAEAAQQVSATMTGIVDRLLERGLVSRARDPEDRRALRVALTPAGEELLGEIERRRKARLQEALSQLAPGDRAEMLRLVHLYLQVIVGSESAQTGDGLVRPGR